MNTYQAYYTDAMTTVFIIIITIYKCIILLMDIKHGW